jgi:hypothetical protein
LSLRTVERIGELARPAAERPAVPRVQSAARMRSLMFASALVLFLVALYPRAINLSGYLTTDEGNWMGRTALFTRALINGDPAGTYQSGHPGVMTMWSSLIGMGPERALALVEYVRPDGLEKAPNYLETLHLARRTVAVCMSPWVVWNLLVSWRMLLAVVGWLTGSLLAFVH